MERPETMLPTERLNNPDDLDALLEFADLVRRLTDERRTAELSALIAHTVEHRCHEALSWALAILEEAFAQEEGGPEPFACPLGRAIPDYDAFLARLRAQPEACKSEVETVRDEHGEVTSFYHIFTYRTGFDHVFLRSAENFDTKDNDFIQYRLLFGQS
ncbi:MAG: hypothetical protein IJC43_03425 [Clostridia bacterium]|nr:hypothetical protein [Clostridia bacterium]